MSASKGADLSANNDLAAIDMSLSSTRSSICGRCMGRAKGNKSHLNSYVSPFFVIGDYNYEH
jgi:hypothetical protein